MWLTFTGTLILLNLHPLLVKAPTPYSMPQLTHDPTPHPHPTS